MTFTLVCFILQLGRTACAEEKNYEIDLSTLSNEQISAFKLMDSNKTVIVLLSRYDNSWKHKDSRVLKIGVPNGDLLWDREYEFEIRDLKSSPSDSFILLVSYQEYKPSISIIIDANGREISRFKQKKVFFVTDTTYVSCIDPQYAFGEVAGDVSTEISISNITNNSIYHKFDLGGEVIDAVLSGSYIKLIIAKNRDQELYQINNLSKNITHLGKISENVLRQDQISFFLNDSIIISNVFHIDSQVSAIHVTSNGITRAPVLLRQPDDIEIGTSFFEFLRYSGGIAYVSYLNSDKIIGIPFVEDIDSPLVLFKLCGRSSDKIELQNSAFFQTEKNEYMLSIPRTSARIKILEIEK